MNARSRSISIVFLVLIAAPLRGENRSVDGSGNSLAFPTRGAANTPFIRLGYKAQFFGADSALPNETQRANARAISNTIAAQAASRPSSRHLSNYIWAWGQFLTHDTDLSTTSNGASVNGTAPIPINIPGDPLGPNPIPFTRANFTPVTTGGTRTPINEVTTYIDASNVYGSDATRAAALRTGGGTGAKLLTDTFNLLPRNTAGLPNENNGPVPGDQLFLAGDIRSSENSLLTSLHTLFAREHNRLVDRIAALQPGLGEEDQYQLARKLVGAEMQSITYREFLPALLGSGPTVPTAQQYAYNSQLDASVTTVFSHAAFRFGHSAVTSRLNLVNTDGTAAGNLALREVFFNPNLIGNNPGVIDKLLQGAATQHSEEIDTLIVDDLRNFLFGPPGAGGLDLASLNVQRGRDAGLPNFYQLTRPFGVTFVSNFSQITSDATLAQALVDLYNNQVESADLWALGLAQNHVPGASVGDIFKSIITNQFRRLRDGDRLFYRGNAAGLYTDGVVNPDIAAIVDLDNLTLGELILANTDITQLQNNVFFVPMPGDFNGDGMVDTADYVVWRKAEGTNNAWADADGSGTVGPEDLAIWRANFGNGSPASGATFAQVPEPLTVGMLLLSLSLVQFNRRGQRARRRMP